MRLPRRELGRPLRFAAAVGCVGAHALVLAACGTVTPGRLSQSAACLHQAALPSPLKAPSAPASPHVPRPPLSSPVPEPSFSLLAPPEPGLGSPPVSLPSVAPHPPVQVSVPPLTPIPDPCPPSITPGQPSPAAVPLTAAELHGVWFIDGRQGWMAGGDASGHALAIRTTDGGRTWSAGSTSDLPTLNKVLFTDANHGWASFLSRPGVTRTLDGGRTWLAPTEPANGYWTVGDITFPDAGHGWQIDSDGAVRATSDGGASWRILGRAPLSAIGIFFVDQQHGWIVGGTQGTRGIPRLPVQPAATSVVYSTSDGGATWHSQAVPVAMQMATGVRFANAREGWMVGLGQGLGQGLVLGTNDGGATWVTEVAMPTSQFVNGAMTYRSNRYAWAAFGDQVVATTDGVHWAAHPVSHRIIGPSRLSFGDPVHGWIAGSDSAQAGSGFLLYSSDGGASWAELAIPGQRRTP